MDKGKIIIPFILVLLICESYPKRDFYIYISHANCTSPSKVMTATCSVTTWNNRNRVNGFNMFIQTSEDVDNIRYNISIQHLTRSGKSARFLEFNNLSVCEFNGAKFKSPFLLIARKIMKKYSNVPDGCPFKKDKAYYIQRMKFDPELFPSYLPEGQFEVIATLYRNQVTLVEIDLGFQVERKSNLKSTNKTVLKQAKISEI